MSQHLHVSLYLMMDSFLMLLFGDRFLTGGYTFPVSQPSPILVCLTFNGTSWFYEMGISNLGVLCSVHSSRQFTLFKFLSFYMTSSIVEPLHDKLHCGTPIKNFLDQIQSCIIQQKIITNTISINLKEILKITAMHQAKQALILKMASKQLSMRKRKIQNLSPIYMDLQLRTSSIS